MYDEPFLINAPRKRRKKASGKRRRRKSVAKTTVRRRRKAVATVAAPKRRRRRRKVVRVVAAAPKRRRRRRTAVVTKVRRKRGRRKGHRSAITGMTKHRPVVYGSGRVWKRSPWSKSKKRHVTINPPLALVGNRPRRRGRRRSNPMQLSGIPNQLMNILPLAATGIASGVVTDLVPGYLNLSNQWMNYGVKAGVAIFGGQMVGKFAGQNHGLVWTVVGISSVVKDIVRMYMPGVIPGLSGSYPSYYGATSIGAYPGEVGGMDAFPTEDYPDSGAYAGMGESPYPY